MSARQPMACGHMRRRRSSRVNIRNRVRSIQFDLIQSFRYEVPSSRFLKTHSTAELLRADIVLKNLQCRRILALPHCESKQFSPTAPALLTRQNVRSSIRMPVTETIPTGFSSNSIKTFVPPFILLRRYSRCRVGV